MDEAGDPLPAESGLTVTAVPHQGTAYRPGGSTGRQERGVLDLEATPNEDGFFHLTGLLPGAYVLHLEAEGYALTESPVVGVVGTREAELLAPLVIRRPLDLAVRVEPPVDGRGEPWSLLLIDSRSTRPVASGGTGPDGRWTAPGVAAGSYSAVLQDSRGRRVLHGPVEVGAASGELVLTVERVEVEGEVRLGDEPLAGAWRVDVRSRRPAVFRRLTAVEVTETSDGGPSRVVLELPDSLLEGEVVDGDGRPVTRAAVMVHRSTFSETPSSVAVDENGRFRFRGLAPGAYRLTAADLFGVPEGYRPAPAYCLTDVTIGSDPDCRSLGRMD